ncbi:alpha-hydroxy acid oxidase [Schumannella sp. 10F1B-5-1]|uniref:alpha-hydroxy acid oxidase n=1 Tax=Schumannella sp. 10F1B-5-1 TaxID=2590780 RepID=UPI001130469A|nr:alpha-hydroxy acid oxidase [Schumannella sp. 10F1B-5-1]TPW78309.1 alpha-hydroxy-acid oxidizing protein [Schumannella sp. 10F1B-5-1]
MAKYPPLARRIPQPSDITPFLRLKSRSGLSRAERRVADAHTIEDLRRLAKRRTPAGPFHYVDGGAESEISMRRAREAFDDLEFNPEILRDVHEVDTTTTVLGKQSALPFGFGPTGGTRMMHAAGESAVARAAERAGIPYGLSTVGTTSIADFAAAAPGARHWFQMYLLSDRERSLRMLAEAQANGFDTLVVTVDSAVVGNRLRDARYGMSYPPQLTVKTFLDASYRVEWWTNLLTTEPYRFTYEEPGVPRSQLTAVKGFTDSSVTFDDLAWMREAWSGPIVLKGIQTLDDAVRAADSGVDGIVLSNHGGRQLDRAIPPLHLLPSVAARVGASTEVMLDTGVRTGADVVAAIALGAKFVLLGRAYLYALMAGGEAGVDRAVQILRAEIRTTMALLGVTSIDELRPEHVTLVSRYTRLASTASESASTPAPLAEPSATSTTSTITTSARPRARKAGTR